MIKHIKWCWNWWSGRLLLFCICDIMRPVRKVSLPFRLTDLKRFAAKSLQQVAVLGRVLAGFFGQDRQLIKSAISQNLLYLLVLVQEQGNIEPKHRVVHLCREFLHLLKLSCISLEWVQEVELVKVLQLLIRQFIGFVNSLFQSLIPKQLPVFGSIDTVTYLKRQLEIGCLNGQRELLLWVLDYL